MNQYITGSAIRTRREDMKITQSDLADMLGVSDKTVSKWETGRGYPDITLLEPLATALKTSVVELLSGEKITNKNLSANLMKVKFYVCPMCGNVITAFGEAQISCCGISLMPQEVENDNEIITENVEDEILVSVNHPMTKEHYISFLALAKGDDVQIYKLYPEGECSARFKRRGHGILYSYCNRHGLSSKRI